MDQVVLYKIVKYGNINVKLFDSVGYIYIFSHSLLKGDIWICNGEKNDESCNVTILQTGSTFEPNEKKHNHDPNHNEYIRYIIKYSLYENSKESKNSECIINCKRKLEEIEEVQSCESSLLINKFKSWFEMLCKTLKEEIFNKVFSTKEKFNDKFFENIPLESIKKEIFLLSKSLQDRVSKKNIPNISQVKIDLASNEHNDDSSADNDNDFTMLLNFISMYEENLLLDFKLSSQDFDDSYITEHSKNSLSLNNKTTGLDDHFILDKDANSIIKNNNLLEYNASSNMLKLDDSLKINSNNIINEQDYIFNTNNKQQNANVLEDIVQNEIHNDICKSNKHLNVNNDLQNHLKSNIDSKSHEYNLQSNIDSKSLEDNPQYNLNSVSQDNSQSKINSVSHEDNPQSNIARVCSQDKSQTNIDSVSHENSKSKVDSVSYEDNSQSNINYVSHEDNSQPKIDTLSHEDNSQPKIDSVSHEDNFHSNVDYVNHEYNSQPKIDSVSHEDNTQYKVASVSHEDNSQPKIDSVCYEDNSQPKIDSVCYEDNSQHKIDSVSHDEDNSQSNIDYISQEDISQPKIDSVSHEDNSQSKVASVSHEDNSQLKIDSVSHEDNSQSKVAYVRHEDNSQPKIDSICYEDNSQSKIDSVSHEDNSQPKIDTLSHEDNSQPKIDSVSHEDNFHSNVDYVNHEYNSQPKIDSVRHEDNSQYKVASVSHEDNSQPKIDSVCYEDNSQHKIDSVSHEDNSQSNTDYISQEDISQPKIDSVSHEHNSQSKVASVSHEDNSQLKIDSVSHEDNSQSKVVSVSHEDNSQPKIDSICYEDNSQSKIDSVSHDNFRSNFDYVSHEDKSQPEIDSISSEYNSQSNVKSVSYEDNSQSNVDTLSYEDNPQSNVDTFSYEDNPQSNIDSVNHKDNPQSNVDFVSQEYNPQLYDDCVNYKDNDECNTKTLSHNECVTSNISSVNYQADDKSNYISESKECEKINIYFKGDKFNSNYKAKSNVETLDNCNRFNVNSLVKNTVAESSTKCDKFNDNKCDRAKINKDSQYNSDSISERAKSNANSVSCQESVKYDVYSESKEGADFENKEYDQSIVEPIINKDVDQLNLDSLNNKQDSQSIDDPVIDKDEQFNLDYSLNPQNNQFKADLVNYEENNQSYFSTNFKGDQSCVDHLNYEDNEKKDEPSNGIYVNDKFNFDYENKELNKDERTQAIVNSEHQAGTFQSIVEVKKSDKSNVKKVNCVNVNKVDLEVTKIIHSNVNCVTKESDKINLIPEEQLDESNNELNQYEKDSSEKRSIQYEDSFEERNIDNKILRLADEIQQKESEPTNENCDVEGNLKFKDGSVDQKESRSYENFSDLSSENICKLKTEDTPDNDEDKVFPEYLADHEAKNWKEISDKNSGLIMQNDNSPKIKIVDCKTLMDTDNYIHDNTLDCKFDTFDLTKDILSIKKKLDIDLLNNKSQDITENDDITKTCDIINNKNEKKKELRIKLKRIKKTNSKLSTFEQNVIIKNEDEEDLDSREENKLSKKNDQPIINLSEESDSDCKVSFVKFSKALDATLDFSKRIINLSPKDKNKRDSYSEEETDSITSVKKRKFSDSSLQLTDIKHEKSCEEEFWDSFSLDTMNSSNSSIKIEAESACTDNSLNDKKDAIVKAKKTKRPKRRNDYIKPKRRKKQTTPRNTEDSEAGSSDSKKYYVPLPEYFLNINNSRIVHRERYDEEGCSVIVECLLFSDSILDWVFSETLLSTSDSAKIIKHQQNANSKSNFVLPLPDLSRDCYFPVELDSSFPFSMPGGTKDDTKGSLDLCYPLEQLRQLCPSAAPETRTVSSQGKQIKIKTIELSDQPLEWAFKETLLSRFEDSPILSDLLGLSSSSKEWPDATPEFLRSANLDYTFPFTCPKRKSYDNILFSSLEPKIPSELLDDTLALPSLPNELVSKMENERDALVRLMAIATINSCVCRKSLVRSNEALATVQDALLASFRPLIISQANQYAFCVLEARKWLLDGIISEDKSILPILLRGPIAGSRSLFPVIGISKLRKSVTNNSQNVLKRSE